MRKLFMTSSLLVMAGFTYPLFALTPIEWREVPVTSAPVGQSATVDVGSYLSAYDETAPRVMVTTNVGDFTMQLRPDLAPATVANFLNYVKDGDYSQSFFHRSMPGFVIQTGGFRLANNNGELTVEEVPTDAPVVNEYNLSNLRGTVAMAKLGNDPNSATSQWFVNLVDNSSNLDNQNGGFTVFAEVTGDGMSVVDAIAALQTYNFGGAFTDLPLISYDDNAGLLEEDLVTISSASILPDEPSEPSGGAALEYSVVSVGDSDLLAAEFQDGELVLTPTGLGEGNVEVTILAFANGRSAETSITVSITTPPEGPESAFSEVFETGGGWWFSGWFGAFYADTWPWIFSVEHGWQYVLPSGKDTFWAWDMSEELGWMWTGQGVFPAFYLAASDEFIIYGIDAEGTGWYYFLSTESWQKIY